MQKKLIAIIIASVSFNLLNAASPTFNLKGGTTFDLNGCLELKEGISSGKLTKTGDGDVTIKREQPRNCVKGSKDRSTIRQPIIK